MFASFFKLEGNFFLSPTVELIGFRFLKNEKSHPLIHGEGQTILCCLKAKVKVVSQNNEFKSFLL
jgi:hypothetical protein